MYIFYLVIMFCIKKQINFKLIEGLLIEQKKKSP